MTLLLISTATALTQTQLETYSDNNIQTYLISHLKIKGTSLKYENNIKFYMILIIMDDGALAKGVFYFQEPTELALKSCSFFGRILSFMNHIFQI